MELTINSAPDFEHDENDASTWRRFSAQEVPSWVQRDLIEIAGLNPHGEPILRCKWAADMVSDRTEKFQLKYSCGYSTAVVNGYKFKTSEGDWQFIEKLEDLPNDVMVLPDVRREELGLPRFVIEKWESPEALDRARRYRQRYAPDELEPTLRAFPRQGLYDLYLIVENLEGHFRPVDKDIINFVKMRFHYEQKPFEVREKDRKEIEKREAKARREHSKEIWKAAANFDLRLPRDEKERRDHYWATLHDYRAEAERLKHRTSFYFANTGQMP
jgi:hypothetical protein